MERTFEVIETQAPPEAVFSVVADLESYPEWASGVRITEVLELDDEGRARRARFVVEGIIKEISYVLRYDYDPPRRISWTAEPGEDIRLMEGYYEFTGLPGGGTQVVYALRVTPGFSVPGFLRRQAEKQIRGAALRGLKRRAEAQAGAQA
ncbi:MAG: SRPBCC family protein [Actinomycetota bacterium]|nr:SRPBCC family protein [Actinomycetota bacterium]